MNRLDEPLVFTAPKQIVPHLPIWAQSGSVETARWVEPFEDRVGNKANVCYVEYRDKKGKMHVAVAWVKWETM